MRPGQNEIHIWHIDDQDPEADIKRMSHVLTASEWDRHNRFVFEKERRRYLITRAMLREVLSRYRPEIDPTDWEFTVNDYGKPRIHDAQCDGHLYFNIAHTAGAIVLAVQSQPDIGIDTERFDRKIGSLSFCASVLSPRELADLQALPRAQQARRFLTIWTLKEAYIKAVGKGLSIPLDGIGFDLSDHTRPKLYLCGHQDPNLVSWRFKNWSLTPNHAIALAFRQPNDASDDTTIRMCRFS